MTPTLRRLNDPERYYGLSWREWGCALAAGGVLYGAVTISPLGFKPTITITVLVLAFGWLGLHAVSGQAIAPGRLAVAYWRYRRSPKVLACPDEPDTLGLVLTAAPEVES